MKWIDNLSFTQWNNTDSEMKPANKQTNKQNKNCLFYKVIYRLRKLLFLKRYGGNSSSAYNNLFIFIAHKTYCYKYICV